MDAKEAKKRYDITNIFFQSVLQDRERMGQVYDEGDIIVALYPSEYKKALLNTTEKKLQGHFINARRHTQPRLSDSRVFKTIPTEIIFKQFIPGGVYQATLTIINTQKISHLIRLSFDDNPVFCMEFKGSANAKLAPGMSHICQITFCPEEKKDYMHQVTIISDCETLTVPIIAIGPRAFLDFPDRIIMPESPVKIPSTKAFVIRNGGNSTAVYTVYSNSANLTIEPARGVIKEDDTGQFIVNFLTCNAGSFTGIIFLKYETGEILRIDVEAFFVTCNVQIATKKLQMDDTFLGLTTTKVYTIRNNSDYQLKYRWMKYKNIEDDKARKEKFSVLLNTMKNVETTRYVDLQYFNVCRSEIHESICERIYSDEVSSLNAENFLFNDTQFTLMPMEGEIRRKSSVEINVNFQPQIMAAVTSIAYLDVAGQEERIGVEFCGACIGPILKLNSSTIDMQRVYPGVDENLEVICTNEGLIPGTLIYKEMCTDFGGTIVVTPNHQEIQPQEYKSFNLNFSSLQIGEFIETVDFIIEESGDIVPLYIKGEVVRATLTDDTSHLDLASTALGISQYK